MAIRRFEILLFVHRSLPPPLTAFFSAGEKTLFQISGEAYLQEVHMHPLPHGCARLCKCMIKQHSISIEAQRIIYNSKIIEHIHPIKLPEVCNDSLGQPTVIIVRVPSIKIPFFFAQHTTERDRHRIQNNHPFILEVNRLLIIFN